MRLIDADAFLERMSRTDRFFSVVFDINDAPTVDAVPVVRCRECEYAKNAKVNKKGFLICPASHMEIVDDDYCSYGERETNGQGLRRK